MHFPKALLILCFLVGLSVQTNPNTENESEDDVDISDIVPVPYDSKLTETLVRGGGGGLSYDYSKVKGVGPKLWNKVYPDYCDGKKQSPIDLKGAKKMSYPPFKFMKYTVVPEKMMISNNGHTVVVGVDMESMPMISGGGLPGTFKFLQMHWHWGANPKKGSEHTVKGKMYPIELHLVHVNTKYGDDVQEALKNPDGLAVLGVLIKTAKKKVKKSPYRDISKKLNKIKKDGKTTMITPRKLCDFLPKDTKKFYRYEGSLTTPSCNEVVTWTVFKKTQKIKEKWLKKFTKVKTNLKVPMVNNYRPVQPLNGRTLYMC